MTDRPSPPRGSRSVLTLTIPSGASTGGTSGGCGCPPESAPPAASIPASTQPAASIPTSTLADEVADLLRRVGDDLGLLGDLLPEYVGDAMAPAALVHIGEMRTRERHLTDLVALRASLAGT